MTSWGETSAPASYLQRAMWAAARRYRRAPLNHMILSSRIQGPLDVGCLELALSDVVARHASLRTRLSFTDGRLVQIVGFPERVQLTPASVGGSTCEGRLHAARLILREEGATVMDLSLRPPLRLRLLRISDTDHVLGLLVHHSICDGWSTDVIMRDLTAFYAARAENRPADLPELSQQFTDFAAWELSTHERAGFARELAYWKEELADPPPPIELASIVPRAGNKDWSVACPAASEPPDFLAALKDLARKRRVSLFSVLLTGFSILLHERTRAEDVLVGVSTANRWSKQAMQVVGSFTNLLPARVRPTPDLALDELLIQVHLMLKRLMAYGRVPLALIPLESQTAVDTGPELPVWCQLVERTGPIVVGPQPVSFEPFTVERAATQCELEADLTQSSCGLECLFAYRAALFSGPMMTRMIADYGAMLRHMVREPGLCVRELCARIAASP